MSGCEPKDKDNVKLPSVLGSLYCKPFSQELITVCGMNIMRDNNRSRQCT